MGGPDERVFPSLEVSHNEGIPDTRLQIMGSDQKDPAPLAYKPTICKVEKLEEIPCVHGLVFDSQTLDQGAEKASPTVHFGDSQLEP